MISSIGIPSMKETNIKNSFQVKEICRIIETCRKFQVSKLKFKDLEIHLNESPGIVQGFDVHKENVIQKPASAKEIEDAQLKISLVDEQTLEELELSQLALDDPLAYETLVCDEHLARTAQNAQSENRRAQPAS